MTEQYYLSFIRRTLDNYGLHVADIVNKQALERKEINQPLYSKAAAILAEEILKR